MFNLPSTATPGPPVSNSRYERINSVTDMKQVIGGTHTFRIEPSGTDWWVPARSYFRTRLKLVVSFCESKYPAWHNNPTSTALRSAKDTKQPTSWPLPPRHCDSFIETETGLPICRYPPGTSHGISLSDIEPSGSAPTLTVATITSTGLRGDVLKSQNFVDGASILDPVMQPVRSLTSGGLQRIDNSTGMNSSLGINYISAFKPLTCLKFLELADCAVDAFFDQMSASVGPQKVETVHYPQLINVMRRRMENSPAVNATRFDNLGVFGDEQQPHLRHSNRANGKTSVYDLLGYDRIEITETTSWEQEYTVEFDVLYIPPISLFELDHALPPARYEIEFKGVSNAQVLQNNFFHCTMPGGTGRWFMEKKDNLPDAGILNTKGPATAFDNRHAEGRTTISQHAGASIFLFEPPVAAGPDFNRQSIQNHYLGRRACTESWLKTPNDRLDPGCFVSIQMVNMHLEASMVTGPMTLDTQFMLEFDQTQANFITLADTHQMQNLIFDVDPYSNFFYFGFRQTTVSADVCLQEGHLVCPGNVERDLREYYISFDMKTNPPNFATEINLYNLRGATNELIRSQTNNSTIWKHVPETTRSWLKKGPFYAYEWPRDGTSNATRFQLNLQFHDPTLKINQGSMGPHGMFENETPLVHVNTALGFHRVGPTLELNNSLTEWKSGSVIEGRSNSYVLKRQVYAFNSLLDRLAEPSVPPDPEGKNAVDNALQKHHWFTPPLFWSLYYPASLSLLSTQTRIDSCDRVEPSIHPALDYTKTYDDAVYFSDFWYTVTQLQQSLAHVSQAFGSAQEIDQSYKGTEASRPYGLSLGSSNNSCVLFQSIPRKWIISTASGRVIGARTLDNRTI